MLRRALATTVTLAVVLAGLVACGDEEKPDPEPTQSAAFDPEALDLGRIEPTGTDLSTVLTGASSRLVGAYALGSSLVLPQQLRSGLDKYGVETGVLTEATEYEYSLSDAGPALAGGETGILTRRVDVAGDAWITTALVQFPDDATAQAAAQAAATALVQPPTDQYDTSLVAEPVASDDQAFGVATTTPDIANQVYVLRAFGPFVAYAWVYDVEGDMDEARGYAEDYLAAQEIALEDVEPVRISEEPRVRDLDPSGLWGLTLAVDARGNLGEQAYVSGGHAAQSRQINADGIELAFETAGVSRVASNLTSLYATKDAEGAESLVAAFVEQATGLGMVEAESPQGLSDAVCFAKEDEENPDLTLWPSFICFFAYGAYVLESSGVSAQEAQQRLSAQAVLVYEKQQDQKRSSG